MSDNQDDPRVWAGKIPLGSGNIYAGFDNRSASVLLTAEERREKVKIYMQGNDAEFTAQTMLRNLVGHDGGVSATAASLDAGFLARHEKFGNEAKDALNAAITKEDAEGKNAGALAASREKFYRYSGKINSTVGSVLVR